MDKYGQRVFRRASGFPAVMDGECEAQQLLLRPLVVCLEKSRMCHNKYTSHCVSGAAVCFNLHVSIWPCVLYWSGTAMFSIMFLATVGRNNNIS